MKPSLALLLAPTLALCGTFSGSVVSLDGTPVAGAVIKAGTDSVTTTPNGSWTLARASGIASRSGKTISVTSHLTVENGHPRLSFAGMDILGRAHASGSPAGAMRSSRDDEGSAIAAARSQGSRDTLRVHWKGKRLTVLTAPSDTGSITFKIDTAWSDDAGIPWNPRISYGSLLDARDGQTYRTVTIGTNTWMAQNLNYADFGKCNGNSSDSCVKYGRQYTWTEVMMGRAYNVTSSSGVKDLCPTGWHVPSDSEWTTMRAFVDEGHTVAGTKLKSTAGWKIPGNGTDDYGFHALPGTEIYGEPIYSAGRYGTWWSATANDAYLAYCQSIDYNSSSVSSHINIKTGTFSLRCIQD